MEAMGRKAALHRLQCPMTARVLDRIPGVFQAFFSILEGGKSIPTHRSPYWGYLRYHLALDVPKQGPQPRMRVGGQWLTWEGRQGLSVRRFMGPRVGQRKSQSTLCVDRRRRASDGKALPCRPFGPAVHHGPNVCTVGAAPERNLGRHGPRIQTNGPQVCVKHHLWTGPR